MTPKVDKEVWLLVVDKLTGVVHQRFWVCDSPKDAEAWAVVAAYDTTKLDPAASLVGPIHRGPLLDAMKDGQLGALVAPYLAIKHDAAYKESRFVWQLLCDHRQAREE